MADRQDISFDEGMYFAAWVGCIWINSVQQSTLITTHGV